MEENSYLVIVGLRDEDVEDLKKKFLRTSTVSIRKKTTFEDSIIIHLQGDNVVLKQIKECYQLVYSKSSSDHDCKCRDVILCYYFRNKEDYRAFSEISSNICIRAIRLPFLVDEPGDYFLNSYGVEMEKTPQKLKIFDHKYPQYLYYCKTRLDYELAYRVMNYHPKSSISINCVSLDEIRAEERILVSTSKKVPAYVVFYLLCEEFGNLKVFFRKTGSYAGDYHVAFASSKKARKCLHMKNKEFSIRRNSSSTHCDNYKLEFQAFEDDGGAFEENSSTSRSHRDKRTSSSRKYESQKKDISAPKVVVQLKEKYHGKIISSSGMPSKEVIWRLLEYFDRNKVFTFNIFDEDCAMRISRSGCEAGQFIVYRKSQLKQFAKDVRDHKYVKDARYFNEFGQEKTYSADSSRTGVSSHSCGEVSRHKYDKVVEENEALKKRVRELEMRLTVESPLPVSDPVDSKCKIGNGGFADVFLVKIKGIEKHYIFKKFRGDNVKNCITEFRGQQQIYSKCQSCIPRPINIVDYTVGSKRIFGFLMEFCQAGSVQFFCESRLSSKNDVLIEKSADIDADSIFFSKKKAALAIGMIMCLATIFEDNPDLVHKDIKPGNFLVRVNPDNSHEIVLSDFGLADVPDPIVDISSSVHSCGTRIYHSYEALFEKKYSQKSDAYALGLSIYSVFSGGVLYHRSYTEPSNMERFKKNLKERNILDLGSLGSFKCLRKSEKDLADLILKIYNNLTRASVEDRITVQQARDWILAYEGRIPRIEEDLPIFTMEEMIDEFIKKSSSVEKRPEKYV
ncbi:hypothetical protein ADUPG1_008936 [Aduncisulcus paluster]|uniref:Protein kinase domain-containing protein n=1 Tax=Aduncisulcus paluster TaxID=2918883 RepID=A0ABQ5KUZ6_9EUKA|nr:hypothetical protein ADUPG1_008936 [Aduncisulcus paluster]